MEGARDPGPDSAVRHQLPGVGAARLQSRHGPGEVPGLQRLAVQRGVQRLAAVALRAVPPAQLQQA
eukprot:scaffold5061_cov378-Prasinococcus_capsulatus_cf.AAC.15